MSKLYIMVGVPLSGKTTRAKQMVNELPNTYIVSRDIERETFVKQYQEVNDRIEDIVTELVEHKIFTYLKIGDVIVDNTHLDKKYFDYYQKTFGGSYDIEYVVMDLPSENEIIKRNITRFKNSGKLIFEKVNHKFRKQYLELIENNLIPQNSYVGKTKTDNRIGTQIPYDGNLDDCVICDLDGTLSMMNGRSAMNGEDCATDVVNKSVKFVLGNIPTNTKIILLSGRNKGNGAYEATLKWLKDNDVIYDELYMREENDYRPDVVLKRELYNKHIKGKYNVVFCLDDRDCVVKLWRNLGLNCFQVNYGNF